MRNVLINDRGPFFKRIIFWGLGFSSTTSILAIPLAGRYISVFSLLLFLTIFLLLFDKGKKLKYSNLDKKFLIWMLISLLSTFYGAVYFIGKDTFQSMTLSYLPKILLYLLLFFLVKRSRYSYSYSKCICLGLLYGCIFNLCWSIADAAGYYTTGISITNKLFENYIVANDMRYGMASLIIGGTIRACGINYDPANIGLFAPIVALYGLKRGSYIIYGLSVISILASLSHTGFLGIVIVTFYYFYSSKYRVAALLSFAAIILVVVSLLSFYESETLVKMADAFIERTEQKTDGSELHGTRGEYWLNFVPAALHQPSALIIGTGYGTASYAYLEPRLTRHDYFAYDPEQTYFSNYFDIGLIGSVVFFSLLYSIFTKSRKIYQEHGNKQYVFILSGIIGTAVAFLGYHYTLYSVVMLLIITGIIQCNTNALNKFKVKIS